MPRDYQNIKSLLVLLIAWTGLSDRGGNNLRFKSNIYKGLSDMFGEWVMDVLGVIKEELTNQKE